MIWLLLSAALGAAEIQETVVRVKGMVCSFCAQGLAKTLRAKPGVEKVSVELDRGLVHVYSTRAIPQEKLEEELREAVEESGFSVAQISNAQLNAKRP